MSNKCKKYIAGLEDINRGSTDVMPPFLNNGEEMKDFELLKKKIRERIKELKLEERQHKFHSVPVVNTVKNDVEQLKKTIRKRITNSRLERHQSHNQPVRAEEVLREVNQEQLMKDISERVQKIRSYTPKVGVFGNSGVGKSSLCNALFGKDIAKISDVEACTRKPQEILIGNNGDENGITLVDVPGIGEDPAHQEEYTALYKSLAPELDLVLWAIKADDRNYASGLDAFQAVFDHKNSPPVIFVITQTDKTNDTDDWNRQEYQPGGSQEGNIARKENDVSKRFNVSTKNIVSIAVQVKDEKLTGKSYNLKPLVDRVVEALPNEKKYSFTREAKEENVSQQARESAEKGIWDSVKNMAGEAWDTVKDKVVDVLIASAPKIISSAVKWFKSWF